MKSHHLAVGLMAIFVLRSRCSQEVNVPVIRAQANIGIANVIVADKDSGEPITALGRDDFLLSANNSPFTTINLRILHFDHGADALRPLAVWLVTECVIAKRDKQQGSSFFRGHEKHSRQRSCVACAR